MAVNIPEIDENIFHDLFDNDEELFIAVLRTFVEKTPDILSKLENVSEETLPDYAAVIHGIKGTCANICAEKARKMALKLEKMAKNGDLSGVLADNEIFLKDMEDLRINVQKYLESHRDI
jgi:HPt (histidine-containing phosphotransfer) domain-containing protein